MPRIISIGAIFFDPQTGDMGPEFSKTIDLGTVGGVIDRDNPLNGGLSNHAKQSAIMTDEIPLDDALLQLREFLSTKTPVNFCSGFGKWSQTSTTRILRCSYERQGICPWRYYNDQ